MRGIRSVTVFITRNAETVHSRNASLKKDTVEACEKKLEENHTIGEAKRVAGMEKKLKVLYQVNKI